MLVGPLTEDEDGVLLWVHTGSATVHAAARTYRLVAGTAVWIPAGVEHTTRTAPGAVVFPTRLPTAGRPAGLVEPRVLQIPENWTDWLIHRWDDNSSASAGVEREDRLLDLVARASPSTDPPQSVTPAPTMPGSHAAVAVAREILLTPGSPHSLETFAARQQVTPKTLQRQFARETGSTFSSWRAGARMAAAARLLREGWTVGDAARRVGFATPAGFTKAFRRHTGLSPRTYALRHASPPPPVERVVPPGDLRSWSGFDITCPPPPIPPRTFWATVNDHHELIWAYRGTSIVAIGEREWLLRQGDALWIPAGLAHVLTMPAGALTVTVGIAYGRSSIAVEDLVAFSFPAAAEAVLLHTMLSEFTLFRPAPHRSSLTARSFREQLLWAAPRAERSTGSLAEIAVELRREPAERRTLAEWAGRTRTSARRLSEEARSQAGVSFRRWRSQVRMDLARTMLRAGDAPGEVARKLAYGSPAAFSRAFTKAHGLTPRDYRRRERDAGQ